MLVCPMGHTPIKTTHYPKTGVCRAQFPKNCCADCPHRDRCKPREQRKTFAVHISAKTVVRAKHLRMLKSDKYIELSRLRNGVEAMPSLLRRCYGIDNAPVFRLLPSKLFFNFAIGALNFGKLIKSLFRQQRETSAQIA